MPTADKHHEIDDRFPTGEWTGFFIQPDGNQRHVMDCVLEFAQGVMVGQGSDPVGEYTVDGTYLLDTGVCSWNKQYVGSHCVEYTGRASNRAIIGHWRISGTPDFWTGPFFLWPRAAGDMKSSFERAFMEYELSTDAIRVSSATTSGRDES